MKITDIETTLAAAKTNRPMGCSYGITHHALGVIVEVITDEGTLLKGVIYAKTSLKELYDSLKQEFEAVKN